MTTCSACGYQAAGPFRFCPECGTPAATAGREQRKIVTVLFCDVVGSTALGESLDPEALRLVLARYFERMKQIVERHGGVVEKFIGDAVMAVFGLPAVHEDDAIRALRAAAEMRAAFAELGVEGRIGVNTGEVVVGTEERLATGDAVNVAARFQQVAEPGEILLGELTAELAGGAAELIRSRDVELKGKAAPVPVWLLGSVSHETVERRSDAPLVGRSDELGFLNKAWERVHAEQRCELVTVVGSAGVGKSRLVTEFVAPLDAHVVRGRCLSYGEEITYWPVVEVLKQLQPLPADLDPAARSALDVLLGREGTSSPDEIGWAFRKLLERVALERRLVVVFDDIQWAADAFLDLLEQLVVLTADVPILVLCMARAELLDRREGWGGVLRLEPLDSSEAAQLIANRLGERELDPQARARILQAAGGNPLFVEEMAAMLQDAGDGDVAVPPTIQALLAARLDQLEAHERTVLENGAIEGEIFHRGGVQALTPEESRLSTRLTALVRRELVRPDKPLLRGDDAYRFRHLLIRDAAYDATPKARRAELHELFAAWLEEHGESLVELDELVGYHLEQAARYLRELGENDGRVGELSRAAAERLKLAASRAMERRDLRSVVALLDRSSALLPEDRLDAPVELDVAWARFNIGKAEEATAGLARAADRAAAAGDELDALKLRLERQNYEAVLRPTLEVAGRLRSAAIAAEPLFEAAGDALGLAVAYGALVLAEDIAGTSRAAMAAAAERLADTAGKAGHTLFEDWGGQQAGVAHTQGPTSVQDCLEWYRAHPEAERSTLGRSQRALLLAMLGQFDEAEGELEDVRAWLAERALTRSEAFNAMFRSEVAILKGEPDDAAASLREACEKFELAGDRASRLETCASLARVLHAAGRDDEAREWLDRAAAETSGELAAQVVWTEAQALLSAEADAVRAEELAREAVALAAGTDRLNLFADTLLVLAGVLETGGSDPRPELERALALYRQKGNLVMADRVERALTDQSIRLT